MYIVHSFWPKHIKARRKQLDYHVTNEGRYDKDWCDFSWFFSVGLLCHCPGVMLEFSKREGVTRIWWSSGDMPKEMKWVLKGRCCLCYSPPNLIPVGRKHNTFISFLHFIPVCLRIFLVDKARKVPVKFLGGEKLKYPRTQKQAIRVAYADKTSCSECTSVRRGDLPSQIL